MRTLCGLALLVLLAGCGAGTPPPPFDATVDGFTDVPSAADEGPDAGVDGGRG